MRVGSLFSGYGGLEMGLSQVLDTELAWVSDIDKGACKILAHRYPGVPNLGDITNVDWSQVEPVDIITAGFPCQPVSAAGKGLGLNDERWLFDEIIRAISELDTPPRLLVLENVPRLRTIDGGNAMAAVIHGLASVGYVGRYVILRASDVGAPHQRERIFVVAHARGEHGIERWQPAPGEATGGRPFGEPTGRGRVGVSAEVALLPTPQAHDHVGGKTPEQITAMRERTGAGVSNLNEVAAHTQQWGVYGRAIARWETLTRPAPPPTMIGRTGKPQLSPRFTEWMMGLPDGWVTDVPGITRNEALKALGNGVVPQQAAAAIAYLLSIEVAA